MAKKKWLFGLAAGVIVVWGATQVGWDEVLGANSDKGALSPPAISSPSGAGQAADGADAADPAASPADGAAPTDSGSAEVDEPSGSASEPDETAEADGERSAVSDLDVLLASNSPAHTISNNAEGLAVVNNTSSILVLVDKKRNLPSDYIPEDLVVPNVKFSFSGENEKKYMRKEAAGALEELFAGAKEDGIELAAVSGYRSYKRQKVIFDANAAAKGAEVANQTSAVPGQSEHQTGLAMDISSASAKYELETTFGETEEGKWLASHAQEYGFIIRYPEGQEAITGYTYEPWHVRYLGKDVAKAVYESGLTLEEFMEQYDDVVIKA
ncbi:M15 family metallopeptidase [Cohnella lubricantis]|uniref:M15 family metallopeptidase n=1 Tax=Cohnella lubricantis TaxID=2163172 RepID=A0A841TIN6_9BACL|nr:M15 family metallopeptidase [Cohnella lubricantis]MBB6679080.1 M15 family metallopeptidase [Cohnella lubricantis]MBP2118535.1 D-alanyl-D-alanine carboxypeptidase [Cohnella lubricantis]